MLAGFASGRGGSACVPGGGRCARLFMFVMPLLYERLHLFPELFALRFGQDLEKLGSVVDGGIANLLLLDLLGIRALSDCLDRVERCLAEVCDFRLLVGAKVQSWQDLLFALDPKLDVWRAGRPFARAQLQGSSTATGTGGLGNRCRCKTQADSAHTQRRQCPFDDADISHCLHESPDASTKRLFRGEHAMPVQLLLAQQRPRSMICRTGPSSKMFA